MSKQTHPAYATVPDWCALSGVGRNDLYETLGRIRRARRGRMLPGESVRQRDADTNTSALLAHKAFAREGSR
jgi:hypothetical protein